MLANLTGCKISDPAQRSLYCTAFVRVRQTWNYFAIKSIVVDVGFAARRRAGLYYDHAEGPLSPS